MVRAKPRICGWGRRSTWGHRVSIPSAVRHQESTRPPTNRLIEHTDRRIMAASTSNQNLKDWVAHWEGVFQPDQVEWCDGSDEEWERLTQLLIDGGTFERLAADKRPNSFLALSDPGDVARVEDRTFICSEREHDAGPTNNWRAPAEMKEELTRFYTGAM